MPTGAPAGGGPSPGSPPTGAPSAPDIATRASVPVSPSPEALEVQPEMAFGLLAALLAVGAWALFGRGRGALVAAAPDAAAPGVVGRFADALGRSRAALLEGLRGLSGRSRLDDAAAEAIEELLIGADVGVITAQAVVGRVRARLGGGEIDARQLRAALRDEVRSVLEAPPALPPAAKPHVILVVGVNGSGKTTTIGKLATQYAAAGKRVLLAAGDTYRAAAADQLQIWAERSGAEIVRLDEGADPSAVAFDAMRKATSGDFDVVIVDTAGRLQTARPLMEQLAKVRRVIAKQVPDAPHETLLVVDGTMGQNALSQARLFGEAAPLTGVVVTKLDGTAKGGVVVALRGETGVPIRWVGVGERAVDLKTFDAQEFVDALLPAD
jgi:fused signal recognition particle receptor